MPVRPRHPRRRLLRAGMALAVLTTTLAATTGDLSLAATGDPSGGPYGAAGTWASAVTPRHACDAPAAHHAACMAVVNTSASDGRPLAGRAATGDDLRPYTAADLRDAYRLPSSSQGAGQTIAIVDAYDDPDAEADLAVYRQANGLPPCTTGGGCLRKVDQRGGTDYPQPDAGWSTEISLDLDMASAVCPKCRLLLVEADDNEMDSLAAAVDRAVALGATAVSNSYGTSGESNADATAAAHYDHPGTVITASSGDWGFGVSVPAAYASVVAVGGTGLYRDDNDRGWTERAWTGAGSGCSAYVAKPAWQHDRLCGKRALADVSAVADPDTPVAMYDTYGYPGWLQAGGTSVSSPIIAGVYALAGNARSIAPGPYTYAHRSRLFDVTADANGECGGGYLCTAVPGYDGPTGLGTPDGTGAF